ncbi:MAG TPA: hypothetical protein VK348_04960 [Planctomycetota bacterium]|nr:hypothetical protein [Planctomycetota bacterium]
MHRVAAAERSDHPLERLMLVRESGDAVEAATTGFHLARRLLAAIPRTWRHHLHVQLDHEHSLLRWRAG